MRVKSLNGKIYRCTRCLTIILLDNTEESRKGMFWYYHVWGSECGQWWEPSFEWDFGCNGSTIRPDFEALTKDDYYEDALPILLRDS